MQYKLQQYNRKQLAEIIKQKFVYTDLLGHLPELRDAGVVLIGSIGYGLYDNKSDIDVAVILDKKTSLKLKQKIKNYKKELKQGNEQIQLFYNTTYEQLEALTDWQDDLKLREYSEAIILCDPKQRLAKLQKRIKWYPAQVYKEKLHWLFAEAVFEFEDRYNTAVSRNDNFYAQVSKLRILQLTMTIMMLLNKSYPIYDKHLYRLQNRLKLTPEGFTKTLNKTLPETDIKKVQSGLKKLIELTERFLISKRLIKNKDRKYWIDLRPIYQVKLK